MRTLVVQLLFPVSVKRLIFNVKWNGFLLSRVRDVLIILNRVHNLNVTLMQFVTRLKV